jgi:hypothetical protein
MSFITVTRRREFGPVGKISVNTQYISCMTPLEENSGTAIELAGAKICGRDVLCVCETMDEILAQLKKS